MNTIHDDLLKSIDLALRGEWDAAHQLVQRYEDDRAASWIHAVLHKMEGDIGNSRYWYGRAGKTDNLDGEPHAELAVIRESLRNSA